MIWKRNTFRWIYLGLLLLIFSVQLLFPNTASSQGIVTYNPTDYNLLGATSYISGELTDIQSNDATSMRFRSNYETDISDFADNISDVDSSMDKGTHSNFTAQQYGPDSINDTLTEVNTGGASNTTLIDAESFEGGWPPTGWTETFGSAWNRESNSWSKGGTYSADFDGGGFLTPYSGYLTSPSMDCSDADAIYVDFWWYDNGLDDNDFELEYYDGSTWDNYQDLNQLQSGNGEHHYTEKIIDSQYFVSNFRIRWWARTVSSGETGCVDLVTVKKEIPGADNYELDLEVQWINATHNVSNAELCIFGMTQGSEKISVDVWNGTTWQDLLVDLTIGWNNISVSNYLYSSTFTIRFKGGNETGDTSQDSWNIDVTLLHIWSNDMAVEVEFLGSSNIDNWSQLTWTVDSAWTTGSVNVTLQLYNYTLSDYSPSGNGYVSYASNSILDENETVDQIVTANPTHFRNATGHWKMKIKGVKAIDSQLELQIDLIKYEVALPQSFDWTTAIVCTVVVLGFLLPFAVRFKRKKKRHKPTTSTHTFLDRFGVTPQQMVGKKILLEVDPTLDYHNALFGFVSKAITDGQSLFIFTGKNSPLHTAFCAKNIGFFLLTSKISSSKRINKKEVLIPVSDLSVLLDAFAKIPRERTRKPRTILFDNLSDTILMCGFDKTYRFLRFLLEAISSPKITALFIFNPSAHNPAISSSIRGLFQFRLTDLKPKIVESIRRD